MVWSEIVTMILWVWTSRMIVQLSQELADAELRGIDSKIYEEERNIKLSM